VGDYPSVREGAGGCVTAARQEEPDFTAPAGPIGVSGLFIRTGRVGGAEFMTYGLVQGLLEAGRTVAFLRGSGIDSLDAAFRSRHHEARQTGRLAELEVRGHSSRFVQESLSVPGLLRSKGIDRVIFPNYFTPPGLRGLRAHTAILDLQYLHFPKFFSAKKRLWLRVAHEYTLRSAHTVSAISEHVRQDVLERYGQGFATKVRTIPIGIDWTRFDDPVRPTALLPRHAPFILSVASHYSHKNLGTLLRAFARIADRIPHDLVLVGQRRSQLVGVRDGGVIDLESLADQLGLGERIIFTGHASDAEVGWCYRNATVFVFPSLFEGFGMPAVEALGFRLPVITTRCGSLPEVTLGHAQLVDRPTDEDELAERLVAVVEGPDSYRPAVSEIEALRAHYSPVRIARMYLRALYS
jgi:glycosyltransferase involved in cell wall biosynthesis